MVFAALAAFLAFGLVGAQKIPGLGTVKNKLETFSLSRLLEAEPPAPNPAASGSMTSG